VNSDVDTFTLPQSGTYTLTVEGRVYDTHASGGYAFNLVPNPIVPPQPIFTTNLAPDLIVSTVTVTPGGLQSGGPATVHWTDSNTGNGVTSGSFTDRVTIRNAASVVLVDAFLPYNESDAGNGPIAAGAGRSRQLGVTLPDGTNSVGTLQVTVTTDAQNGIAENNEANNSANTSVTSTLAPYPDLLVSNLTTIPASGWLPGSVVTINWRLTNSGAGIAATNWQDSVVVRNTNTAQVIFSGTTNYTIADAANGSIASGDFRNRSLSFTMPTDASAYGGFVITVTADAAGQLFEYNAAGTAELNNATTIAIISAPDLVPTALAVSPPSGSIHSGDTVTVSWSDQNNGTVDTGAGFSDRIVVVNTNTSETLLNTTLFYNPNTAGNGPIAPGGSRSFLTTLQLPDGPRGVGTLEVTITADTFNQLPEANVSGTAEANNTVIATAISTIAAYPDLQVISLNIQPGTLASGTNVTIQWQDTNSGNATAAANWNDRVTIVNTNSGVTLLDTTVPYGTNTLGPLTNGTARSRSYSFTLPNGTAAVGNLRFSITADTFNSVFEYNPSGTGESNNTALVVIGSSISPYPDLQVINLDVQPATLASGTNVTIHWQDANTGNAPALGSWYDHVTVVNTNSGVMLLDTTVVYDTNSAGVLTNGTVRDRSYSFALPYTTNGAGNLLFTVVADTFNNLFEYNPGGTGENNNSNSLIRFSNLTPLPDLIITGVTAPASALTDHAISVQFKVANQGLLAANGNVSQRVFISSTPTPGSGTLVAVTAFNGPLDAGQNTNQSVTLQTPSLPGTYWLIVQADASDNVQELSEANNFSVSTTALTIQPAYTATLTVDLHSALANTPIPMHGLASLGDTGSPAGFVPIKIHVLVRGTDRTYDVLTAGDGTFTNVFYPLPNEAGNYQVAAAFPGVSNPVPQDTFTLIGMSVAPVSLVKVTEGTSVTNTTALSNLSDVPLSGLSVTVVTNQPNLTVTASLDANSLGGFGSANLKFSITALNPSIFQSPVVLRVTSAEGATALLTITVRVEALLPRLVTVPASLSGSMLRGTQTPLAFTLANQGGVATGPLQVVLPNVPWLSLASSNQLPPLPAGTNTVITMLLNPASDLPLGDYNGTLVVQSTNAGLSVPYSFRAVSSATGNMLVSAEDEYTYFAAGAPRVTNALVVLSDALSRAPVVTNYTGPDGTILFTNLTEAFYIVDVTASNHSSFRQSALVAAGATTNMTAFLTRQTVHYNFTVVPTAVQDSYIFTVDSTFETQVPIPVVTIEPASIDLSQYPDTEFQVLLTISNHGLIDAEDVKLNIPSTSRLQLTPLVSDLGKLKANTSLTVPMMVKRIAAPAPITPAASGIKKQDSSSGECSVTGEMLWNYLCGPSVVDKSTAFYAFDSTGCDLVALFRQVYHLVPDAPPATIGSDDFFDYLESLNPVTDFEAPPGYHFECNSAPGVVSAVRSRSSGLVRQGGSPTKQAGNSVCAKVKLSLDQKAVLTRDAFKATLEIDNDTTSPLQNVQLDLQITGEGGAQVTTNFAITPVELSGLTAADGTGTLAGNTVGAANWTLIPTLDAAPTNGMALYLVGGTLHYTQDGSDLTVPLGPSPIQVFPQPELVVRYFHDRDVFSDDPFTPEIEPSIPYSLAIQVDNVGYGDAQALTITSGKPQIIENLKGLLIDFTILGAQLENQPVTPALDVNFGQIPAGTNKIARWLFASSLQGSFTNFSASFKQVDQFGKPRLSLIKSVEIHELTHIVDGNGPLADGRPDFLVNDQPDPDFLPDTIYLSNDTTNSVAAVTNANVTGTLGGGNLSVTVSAAAPAGWSYFRFQDPGQGQFRLTKVLRNDNSEVPFGTNVWTTDRFIRGGSLVPIHTNLVHMLDYNSAGNYTLFYVAQNTTNDGIAPTSLVAALPSSSPPNFTVQWSGADNTGGSGVSLYDVYVSINGGAFTPWITNTTLTAAIYNGVTNNQYAFYSRATDAAGNKESAHASADAQTAVTAASNSPPTIAFIPPRSIPEGALFSLIPSATDADVPTQTLTWSLLPGAPNAALFSSINGHITWQTGPADSGTTNRFTLVVTDNGSPSLSSTQSFNVVVTQTNQPPSIVPPPPVVTVNEQAPMSLHLNATDLDVPQQTLTWQLGPGAPTGLLLNPASGLMTWTPSEAQGPGSYVVTVIVRDNGAPPLSDTNTFLVVVNEVNQPPALDPIGSQFASVLESLTITNKAVDPDLPANTLTFSLDSSALLGATLNPTNGILVWTPTRSQAGTTNIMTVVVTDDGLPPLSASNTFTVTVGNYAEATLGSTTIQAGLPGSVPITIDASAPVTNLTFTFDVTAPGLTNFSLLAPLPPLASATLQQTGPARFTVTLGTLPGQPLLGQQTVTSLHFDSLSPAQSAFVALQMSSLNAIQADGTTLSRTLSNGGRVVLINTRPLLEVSMNGAQLQLTLYATVGSAYTLESTPSLGFPVLWSPVLNGNITNLSQTLTLPLTNPSSFYRLVVP
jgi:subtilase family serine protease